jgi:hypothetical protein
VELHDVPDLTNIPDGQAAEDTVLKAVSTDQNGFYQMTYQDTMIAGTEPGMAFNFMLQAYNLIGTKIGGLAIDRSLDADGNWTILAGDDSPFDGQLVLMSPAGADNIRLHDATTDSSTVLTKAIPDESTFQPNRAAVATSSTNCAVTRVASTYLETPVASLHSWTDMKILFSYGSHADTTVTLGASADGSSGWSVYGSHDINNDYGQVSTSHMTSKGNATIKATFAFYEVVYPTVVGSVCHRNYYQIEAGGWSGATSTYSAGASSGDGCNMSTDTHRLTYANKYGDYATKHSGRGHKFSNGVSWKGFSISSTTGTSYSSDFEFDFGVDGGTTNRNYYLCWIDSNDDTLATAKGNIYAYSDALTTALPPII